MLLIGLHKFDHPYRILIIGRCGSENTNKLLNPPISCHPTNDKIYFYAKDPYQAKYRLLISNYKGVGLEEFNNSKTFIKYSNNMNDFYENIKKYNPDRTQNIDRNW